MKNDGAAYGGLGESPGGKGGSFKNKGGHPHGHHGKSGHAGHPAGHRSSYGGCKGCAASPCVCPMDSDGDNDGD